MKNLFKFLPFFTAVFYFLFLILLPHYGKSQAVRVAILDFQNISGNVKYDGLGKAMSSMLISDIESNVSPKRLQLVERAQIQKILKEQNFQASGSVNKSTAVQAGKILGVKYLLIGDVFILNDQLVINARLTNTETGDIVFSKKQEGKMLNWLSLKTTIAKDLATNLSLPFTEPRISDVTISSAVLTTYANAIDEKDKGNFEKAEILINATKEFDQNFAYLDDLSNEVKQLKKQFENLEIQVETAVENPIAAAINFKQKNDLKTSTKYLQIGLRRLNNNQFGKKYIYFRLLSENYYNEGDYIKSIAYADSILRFYKYDDNAIYFKSLSLVKQNKSQQAISLFKNQLINYEFAWTKKEFFDQIKSFEENSNYKFSGVYVIQLFDKPFQISIDGQPQFEGEIFEQGNFNEQLNRYQEIFKYLHKTPIQFAEEIDLLKLKVISSNLPSYNIAKPYYLPASRYISLKTQGNELVIVETGQSYSGNYYKTYDGKTYTGISPQLCPCKLLFTIAEYDKHILSSKNINDLGIEDRLERERLFAVGWYFLLAKNPEKSINRYSKLLEYYSQFLTDYMEFQGLSSVEKDLIRMSEINIGHSFLLKNDFTNAKSHYLKSNLNNEFNGSNGTTAKDVIFSDWNDLIEKGVFTNKLINEFTTKVNDIFQ
jgi:TolB-like protein